MNEQYTVSFCAGRDKQQNAAILQKEKDHVQVEGGDVKTDENKTTLIYEIYVKKLISLKHCVRSQITRLKLQKSFCDLEHGASL